MPPSARLIKLGLRPERVVENNEVSLYSERHRFSVLAVYIVHLSLLMIFAGGIVDAIYGYRGSLTLTTGEVSNTIVVRQKGMELKKPLPFSIRCDATGQENYADGSPKRWWSDLVVLEKGREIERKQIVVNDPLIYDGIRFYQAELRDEQQDRSSPVAGDAAERRGADDHAGATTEQGNSTRGTRSRLTALFPTTTYRTAKFTSVRKTSPTRRSSWC